MDRLCDILTTYEENYERAETGSKHGKNSEIAGGVMMGVGILCPPLLIAGAAVAGGGAVGDAVWKSKKSSMEATFREDFEAERKKLQDKLFHKKMKDIDQRIEEILRDINNPNHKL
ncbi:unnamed protein product [Leuciscus chuanchicus]